MAAFSFGCSPVAFGKDRIDPISPTPTRLTVSPQCALRFAQRCFRSLPRCRWFLAVMLVALTGTLVWGDDPILRTVVQIQKLTREEAERGSRVRIRGVVTYSDPTAMVFLQDATGGVRVRLPGNGPVPLRGHDVEVEGRTAFDYRPVIVSSKLTLLGEGLLPTPRP